MVQRMKASEIGEKHIGAYVTVSGWLHRLRDIGKIQFLIIRDVSGTIQCVAEDKKILNMLKGLQVESVLKIGGIVQQSKSNKQRYEILVKDLEIISAVKEQVPVEINNPDIKANLETIIDHRSITLRHPRQSAIFKIQAGILQGFRKSMEEQGFTEFRSPVLMAAASETGASVFEVKYYDGKAYLAQSPQIYKQIMVGVYERVYTITPVFRAEKHNTSRHIMEITQMDGEMGFIDDYDEILQVVENVVRAIISHLQANFSNELSICNATLPMLPKEGERFPKLKVVEALSIIEDLKGKSSNRECLDLDPEDERIMSEWAKEQYNSDFVWILNFKKDKNFYTQNDPNNENESISFDLECRGLELLSGTLRINNYLELIESMKRHGISLENYRHYLEAFKYGMPKEGGFSFGLERFTQQVLQLSNIREATLFPSDLDRIGGQRIKTSQQTDVSD